MELCLGVLERVGWVGGWLRRLRDGIDHMVNGGSGWSRLKAAIFDYSSLYDGRRPTDFKMAPNGAATGLGEHKTAFDGTTSRIRQHSLRPSQRIPGLVEACATDIGDWLLVLLPTPTASATASQG